MKVLMILAIAIVIGVGCSAKTGNQENQMVVIKSPTVDEILATDENADLFVMNEVVYVNAEDVDWVQERELTLSQESFEIIKQAKKGDEFSNGTATKIPVGTKVYKPNEKGDIFIAIVDGEEIRYLGWREG
ncbi:hypothetical protein [Bacillus alkalicellulosilyticus]|uniref:hypothetical protein n=1 Tax=Alkalihalobacterium alkalicellulosilyticum TaxID=1912214 RepID=UPI000996ADF8|nr:hypothetical protein [Bacillus alkalicellulosilyticus]